MANRPKLPRLRLVLRVFQRRQRRRIGRDAPDRLDGSGRQTDSAKRRRARRLSCGFSIDECECFAFICKNGLVTRIFRSSPRFAAADRFVHVRKSFYLNSLTVPRSMGARKGNTMKKLNTPKTLLGVALMGAFAIAPFMVPTVQADPPRNAPAYGRRAKDKKDKKDKKGQEERAPRRAPPRRPPRRPRSL